jgi:hypothetical protein
VSFNRENVIWQSPNGTWNRAFYAVSWVDPSPDADPEWDVDYDYGQFDWLSTGHPTEEDAYRSWKGGNPGGYNLMDNPKYVEKLERTKVEFQKYTAARR